MPRIILDPESHSSAEAGVVLAHCASFTPEWSRPSGRWALRYWTRSCRIPPTVRPAMERPRNP